MCMLRTEAGSGCVSVCVCRDKGAVVCVCRCVQGTEGGTGCESMFLQRAETDNAFECASECRGHCRDVYTRVFFCSDAVVQ